MKNIHLDSTSPLDDCPFARHGAPVLTVRRMHLLKEALKGLIFRLLSGRPKRIFPKTPENPRSVLVATGGNLGGAIISLPLLAGVRKRWPTAHLAVVSNRQHGLDIVRRAGLGDSFILAPEVSLKMLILGDKRAKLFRQKIRRLSPELFLGNFDFRLDYLLPLRDIQMVISQSAPKDQNKYKYLYDVVVSYDFATTNWLKGYYSLLNALDIGEEISPHIAVDSRIGREIIEYKTGCKIKLVERLIGVQASVWEQQEFKAWPVDRMAALCERLTSDQKNKILIVGSKGQDSLVTHLKASRVPVNYIDGVGKFSIEELPDVIAACSAVVSNDSGLMHLSNAVGTPTLAIYGMTDPEITWICDDTPKAHIVRRAGCIPCYHKVESVDHFCQSLDCIRNISVDTVYTQLVDLLAY
jgi:ADP-heptose:LPS heptosyltransferase